MAVESWPTLLIVALALFGGGLVKGVTGLGMPLVAVPIMALAVDIRTALPIMTMSLIVSNVWQVVEARRMRETGARFWAVVATIVPGTWFGVALIAGTNPKLIEAMLGLLVMLFVATGLFRWRPSVRPRAERWLGPVLGASTGVMGGLTGIFSPPLAMFFLAAGLGREAFISAMGMTMLAGSAGLAVSLSGHGLLTTAELVISALGLAPALAGVAAGGWVRRRISVAVFQKAVLGMLLVIGAKHLVSAFS